MQKRRIGIVLCAALAGVGAERSGASDPVPTPIGVGPRFHPAAAPVRVLRGLPVGSQRCGTSGRRFGIHLELFARGRVLIVPAGIGVATPLTRSGAYVEPHGCSYPTRTLEPTGVVEVLRGRRRTLRELFAVWGQPLSTTRLAGFSTSRDVPVRAYVGGRRWRGPLDAIRLRPHAQIVLELGPYIPPHATFQFGRSL